jgi:apolipoprotein N-acyltransferase
VVPSKKGSAAELIKNLDCFKSLRSLAYGKYFLLILCGIFQTYAVCEPESGETRGWLQILCIGVLTLVLQRLCVEKNLDQKKVSQSAFITGFFFALGWLCSMFWWIYISLHVYGNLPSILAIICVLILSGGLSVYYAIACMVYVKTAEKLNRFAKALLLAALWSVAELARAQWFTGFPWGAVGYAHLEDPLKLLVPYIGVYGVGGLACLLGAYLGLTIHAYSENLKLFSSKNTSQHLTLISKKKLIRIAALDCLAVLVVLSAGFSAPQLIKDFEREEDKIFANQYTNTFTYSLLQANISQDIKYSNQGLLALDWYKEKILHADSDWIITPETALPVLQGRISKSYWNEITKLSAGNEGGQALLLGIIGDVKDEKNHQQGYANTVLGINSSGIEYRYDKYHLVPFGEFVPPWFEWFTRMLNVPMGSFTKGDLPQPSWNWKGQIVAVNICYEDLFGEELAKSFSKDETRNPTFLVNVSNIAWFGPLLAVEQHLNASRMRAIELHRPLLRATNTGATAQIDEHGYVVSKLTKYTQGVLSGQLKGLVGASTPYALWSGAYSLAPLWVACVFYIALCIWVGKFQKKN